MAKSKKTWAQLETELDHTFSLWPGSGYQLESMFVGAKAAVKRKAGSAGQRMEERAVTLRCDVWIPPTNTRPGQRRPVVLTMARESTALDNLEVLARTVEWIRMAHVRNIHRPIVKLLRQMYPEARQEQQPPPPPPGQERVRSSGPYAALHVADDAPLEVAEAAYRALVKTVHPDMGGYHAAMVALNAAIELIRQKNAKVKA